MDVFAGSLEFIDFVWLSLIIAILGASSSALSLKPKEEQRLARIEEKLDQMIERLDQVDVSGPDAGPELSDRVRRLLDGGNKIQAIAAYRKDTGVALSEAKLIIESCQRKAA